MKYIYLLVVLMTSTVFSQDIISEYDLKLKNNLNERRESIPILNDETNELSLFIVDRKTIRFTKYSKDFQVIQQLELERPKSILKNIMKVVHLGGDTYQFLMSNTTKYNFGIITLDAEKATIDFAEIKFLPFEWHYVNTFIINNRLHVMTVGYMSSKLNIHKIDQNGVLTTQEYDLSSEVFLSRKDKKTTLYRAFKPSLNTLSTDLKAEIIDLNIPNALEVTSGLVKIYLLEDQNSFLMSVDTDKRHTSLINFDLDSSTYTLTKIKKPILHSVNLKNRFLVRSNSFISDNKLYQISGLSKEMRFQIVNLDSKAIDKQLFLKDTDSVIQFKNTPIIEEEGYYVGHWGKEKTKTFLRKITSGKIGVSVYKRKDTLRLMLGGLKKVASGAPVMVGFGAVPIGGVANGVFNSFANPMFLNYRGYTSTRATYIKCLFDKNMNHLQGEVTDNAFDRIRDFSETVDNKKAETIFKFDGYYVYGYYESLSNKYFLRKFEE